MRVIDALAEVEHGEFAGLTSGEIDERWPGALADRERQKYTWRFPGGESYQDAAERAVLALQAIADQGLRRPIVVAHEMIGRMLIGELLQLDPAEALRWNVPHGRIVTINLCGVSPVATIHNIDPQH